MAIEADESTTSGGIAFVEKRHCHPALEFAGNYLLPDLKFLFSLGAIRVGELHHGGIGSPVGYLHCTEREGPKQATGCNLDLVGFNRLTIPIRLINIDKFGDRDVVRRHQIPARDNGGTFLK